VTAGAKSFIFESKLNRQTVRVTIGDVRAWTLSAARDEARRLQTMIDQGIDPRQEKRERIAAAEAKAEEAKRVESHRYASNGSMAAYIEARRANWSARIFSTIETVVKEGGELRTQGRRPGESDKTLPGILRPLLALPLEQIDADRVRAWLKDEATHRPTYARLSFGLLRAFLNWCSDRPEYRDQVRADACITRMAKDELPKKIAKDDCLQREQLPAWFAAVRQIGNPVIAAYLQTALLTGARREEVAGIQWDDVDFQWRSMTIKDKVEGTRTIPLTPYVASLLAACHVAMNGYSAAPPRHLAGFRSRASCTTRHWPLPDCQHSLSTACAARSARWRNGLNARLESPRRSWATSHRATAEKHYRVRPLDLLRMWHTKIECWILNEAGIEQPAKIDGPACVSSPELRFLPC
jgi:integrase